MLQQQPQETNPTDFELMQLYRDWWKDSFSTAPNSQAVIIAASFARHVLDTYGQTNGN